MGFEVAFMADLCTLQYPTKQYPVPKFTTASIQATHPSPSLLDYALTKAAILAFTRALARHPRQLRGARSCLDAAADKWRAAHKKIPEFGTQTPMKRPGQALEMAPLYVLLASRESSYVTGEVYGATGGLEIS
jgi:hypothetical protein